MAKAAEKHPLSKFLPPTYLLLFLIAIMILHYYAPIYELITYPYTLFGIVPIISGFVINIWADRLLSGSGTTVKPHEKPSALVTSGPFSFTRNPQYLGFFLILFGVSIWCGTVGAFIPPWFFLYAMQKIFIPMEEENLLDVFGDEYLEYQKKTRRWV